MYEMRWIIIISFL